MEEIEAKIQKKPQSKFKRIITMIANVFIDFIGMRRTKEKKIMNEFSTDKIETQVAKEKSKKQKKED